MGLGLGSVVAGELTFHHHLPTRLPCRPANLRPPAMLCSLATHQPNPPQPPPTGSVLTHSYFPSFDPPRPDTSAGDHTRVCVPTAAGAKQVYKVTVRTSDKRGAGTDADISIILFGETATSAELKLGGWGRGRARNGGGGGADGCGQGGGKQARGELAGRCRPALYAWNPSGSVYHPPTFGHTRTACAPAPRCAFLCRRCRELGEQL